jgi:hypothetical protein
MTALAESMHFESVGTYRATYPQLQAVRFGGNTFVGWSQNGLTYTQDGVTWRRGEGWRPAAQINSVAYGDGRFVAVGKTGDLAVSKDGAHWNAQNLSNSPAFFDVTFGAGLFVAVGKKGSIATSPDGFAWTLQTATTRDLAWVAYGNGRFVATVRASDGRTPDGFITSTDGIHWRYFPPTPLYTYPDCQNSGCKTATVAGGLIFHEGKFVLLTLTALNAGYAKTFLHSDNGVTWTPTELTPLPVLEIEGSLIDGVMNSLGEANGMLVPPNVAYGNGIYVKVDYDLWYGPDPYQLTKLPRDRESFVSLASNGEVLVGVGLQGRLNSPMDADISIVISANNGETFEPVTPPPGAGGLAAVRYADQKFVAVGVNGTIVTSPDGRSWTKAQSNTAEDIYDVLYAEGKWRAVGEGGQILTSTDARVFTPQSLGVDLNFHSIAYGNGRYVAVAIHNGLFTSTNGTDWIRIGTNLFGGAKAVAFGNGIFVTSGFSCAMSTDGIEWKLAGSPSASGLTIAYGNGYFVSPRLTSAQVEVSRDGKNWEVILVETKGSLGSIDFVNGRFWTAGPSIWRSVLNPQLVSAINPNGTHQLTVQVDKPGAYRILTSTTGSPGSWTPGELLTIADRAQWTNTLSSTNIQFFQVRQEYP